MTADDFGLATEVNDAVEMAHQRGILTSASLMVAAPAAADAVSRARAMPALKVGLHLVLTDGQALSPPSRIPKLVDASGAFRGNMVATALRIALDRAVREQLAVEIAAQFEAFVQTGLALDHVDCHKHFHLHPMIATLILEIGARYGMTALRVPFEPGEIVARAAPSAFDPLSAVTRRCAAQLGNRVRLKKLSSADRVFGLAWTGAMNEARVLALLAHLPDGVSEMYFHPATANVFPGATPNYRYAEELAALVSADVKRALSTRAIHLSNYSDIATSSYAPR